MKAQAPIAFVFLALASPAAADVGVTIDPVISPTYEAAGTQREIGRRGATCLARTVKPGVTTAPTIISTDVESGSTVANNVFEYVDKFLIPTVEQGRSTVTFEAKDGRFRLVHTSIENFVTGQGWTPYKAWSKKVDKSPVRARLLEISDAVAACVKASGRDPNW